MRSSTKTTPNGSPSGRPSSARRRHRGRWLLTLAAVFALALVAAAATQASSGIVGYFQFRGATPPPGCSNGGCAFEEPNSFAGPVGAAVNADGTGGASPGDVYVLDQGGGGGGFSGFGRIQQFSASDQFIRLWGPGVVNSGPDNADEVQAVRIEATGGTFKLGFGAEATADILATAAAAGVEAALEGLGSIGSGGVSVSGGPGDAGGTAPYLVRFDGGSLAGEDQPLLKASDGSSPLSGGAATASTYTTVQGGRGFEVCRPADGDECTYSNGGAPDGSEFSQFSRAGGLGGSLLSPSNMAVDQATGDLYVTNRNRVEAYSASGQFIRAWGQDVVASGPDDSAGPDEQQSVTVKASGGTFTLSFSPAFSQAPPTTAPIPYNAPAATVEAALDALSSIGGAQSSVSVSGGPGDASGSSPYAIAFHGTLGGDDLREMTATATGLTGAEKAATVETLADGGGYEICELDDACKQGAEVRLSGAVGVEGSPDIAVAPAGAPNAGDVLVLDGGNKRVEEFTPEGAFVRMFGWDVVASGPDKVSGPNERQQLTVKATGGSFSLDFGNSSTRIDAGTGVLTQGSTTVTNFEKNPKAAPIAVGEGITSERGLLPAGTTIAAIGADTLTLSKAATGSSLFARENLSVHVIPHDASAAEVQAALNALPSIGGVGGSVSVSGGPGDSAGSSPYTVEFGGSLAGEGLPDLQGQPYNLQNGSGSGSVDVTTPVQGGAFEVCVPAAGDVCKSGTSGPGVGQLASAQAVAEDSSGAIYTAESGANGGQNSRVQKFTPAGGLSLTPSLFGTSEVQALTVNAGAGQFRLSFGAESQGTEGSGDVTKGSTTVTNVQVTKGEFAVGQPISAKTFSLAEDESIVAVGANTLTLAKPVTFTQIGQSLRSNRPYNTATLPYNATAVAVESALDALPSIGGIGGSVSVSGGPGAPGGLNPYLIGFDGGSLADTDPLPIAVAKGATLSGGSGTGANTAAVATTTPGGPGEAGDVAIGLGDHVFVTKSTPLGAASCADGSPSPPGTGVMELDSSGTVLGASDPCSDLLSLQGGGNNTVSLTVNPTTGHPYLLNRIFLQGSRLYILGPPGPAPSLTLEPVSNATSTGGTISGTINPNGPGTVYPDTTGTPSSYRTTYRVEYKKASESSWTKYTPDTPLGSGTSPIAFSVGVGGLAPKTPYELKVVATKPFTATVEEAKSFTTGPAPPEVEALSSSNVTATSADLHALINPQGTETTYRFEYGTTPAYGSETAETNIGESLSGQAVSDHIEGLQDAVYHFRVVATNAIGTTKSADQTFTFHPPVCPNQTMRQQTHAAYLPDCRAYELVSPEDAGGTVLFSGGPQSPYATNPPRLAFVGQLAAIPEAGRNPIDTTGDLYVATRGAEGWHSRYVGPSAEEAACVGGRPIVSGTGGPTKMQNDVIADPGLGRIIDWNLGNPLECFSGSFGNLRLNDLNTAALGSNAPYVWNANGDFLDRWPTAAGDVPGSEANFSCPQDPSIHPYPQGIFGNIPVPYFCSTYVDASKDLNHFVFSTQSGLFGEGGLNAAPGSAYDNDTAHNTLSLVSKLPGGEPIGQEPGAKAGPDELIRFPAVSADGSHILMGTATKPACKQLDYPSTAGNPLCPIVTQPTHLYMRVNDAITYDVSGKPVHYVGSTPDGTKVYFTSDEELTADDTDESTDLYMWSENGGSPTLTRVSAGEPAPAGNSDNCVSTWTSDCDIKTYEDSTITVASGNRGGLGSWDKSNPNPGYTDNAIAAMSGDIYFYSPEQLVAGKGVPGRENFYAYRNGTVRFVAALEDDRYCISNTALTTTCSSGAAGRLQVTPDGRYAAFVTTTNVTAYDSHGHAEMYRYDAETEEVECVSCRPDGSAPTGDVLGSEGGRFISDDGRVFFDTTEPLDPRDTNARTGSEGLLEGSDVYEFTDGRAQLISSGTGTGVAGGEGFSAQSVAGLYGVSGDGVDVYFGTFDTLVGQDRNGAQLKFYDARTNGGFPFVPPPAPCAAADECHGPSSSAPAPLANGSGPSLGSGGNAHRAAKHRKHKHHKKRKRAPRSQSAKRHSSGGGR